MTYKPGQEIYRRTVPTNSHEHYYGDSFYDEHDEYDVVGRFTEAHTVAVTHEGKGRTTKFLYNVELKDFTPPGFELKG